ncbi:MAG TPA: helix-turn-helix domain-containing protein [Acidimicrobiales bacterium]
MASSTTRDEILRAAERLLAQRGIDGVSLREINRAAGQGNTNAVTYHFGDRLGLVRAVLEKHRADTEPRRHALLDQYEESGADDLRALSAALVLPLAAKLADPDGGREYLQIAGQFYTRPGCFDELVPPKDPNNSMVRWHRMLSAVVPVEETTVLHSRFPAIRFALVELARRAAAPPHADDRLFASHLIDLVTALLAATPSAQTRRLAEARGRRVADPPDRSVG